MQTGSVTLCHWMNVPLPVYSWHHLSACVCAATSASVWSWTRTTKSVSATTSRWRSSASSWIQQKSWFTWRGESFWATAPSVSEESKPTQWPNLTVFSHFLHSGIRKLLISMNLWWRLSQTSPTTPTWPKSGSASASWRWDRGWELVCIAALIKLSSQTPP